MLSLDQAEAYAKMLELGSDINTIAIKTGLSESTIKRRLAISEKLCPDAKLLVRESFITIGQAEALTIVSFATQDSVLEGMEYGNIPQNISPTQLRAMLLREKYLVENAIFDVELYLSEGGTISSDLFGDSPDSFDDAELFIRLQQKAFQDRKEELEAKWPWVKVEAEFFSWEYQVIEDAKDDDDIDEALLGAVIVIDQHSNEVTVYEFVLSLIEDDDEDQASTDDDTENNTEDDTKELADFNPHGSRSISSTSTQTAQPVEPEVKAKGYTTKAIIAVNNERTKALQHAVINSKSQKLPLVIILMGLMESNRVAIKQDLMGMDDVVLSESLSKVRETWKTRLDAFIAPPPPHIKEHRLQTKLSDVNQTSLFELLLDLKKSELEELLRYFAASSIAKWNKGSYKLEVDDFTMKLADAEKALQSTFFIDREFLKLFSKDQLAGMQEEVGKTASTSLKKTEQITDILSSESIDVFQPSVLSFKVKDDDADSADS